jgi:hypothetical protein
MSLYAERGSEQTTAAEIAKRAGLTELSKAPPKNMRPVVQLSSCASDDRLSIRQ